MAKNESEGPAGSGQSAHGSGVFRAPQGFAEMTRTARSSGIFPAPQSLAETAQRAAGPGITQALPVPAAIEEAGAAISFVDNGGPVIATAHVQLIFWGTAWAANPVPSMGAVIDAVENILSGPYMTSLNQYRNIQRGTLNGIAVVTTAVRTSPANPPNPFSNGDIETLISNLCTDGRVPGPASDGQLFYCVIVPNGVSTNQAGVIGEHTFFSLAGANAHYAWVMNFGTLNSVTTIFSHELVETVTDPEGSAILGTPGTCNQGGWCEIGDVCTGDNAFVNGVLVQRYWSNRDNSCIVPTDKVVKDNKDTKDTKDVPDNKHHKEQKDTKDHKDHKELKDGAKEKDKDIIDKAAKEKEADDISSLTSMLGQLSQRVDAIGQQVNEIAQEIAQGRSFIRPEERPAVGEQALSQT